MVQSYADATGTKPVTGIGPTWMYRRLPASLARYVGLPIDNVLASDGITALATERLAPTASDHLPVLVRFAVAPRPAGQEADGQVAQR